MFSLSVLIHSKLRFPVYVISGYLKEKSLYVSSEIKTVTVYLGLRSRLLSSHFDDSHLCWNSHLGFGFPKLYYICPGHQS